MILEFKLKQLSVKVRISSQVCIVISNINCVFVVSFIAVVSTKRSKVASSNDLNEEIPASMNKTSTEPDQNEEIPASLNKTSTEPGPHSQKKIAAKNTAALKLARKIKIAAKQSLPKKGGI